MPLILFDLDNGGWAVPLTDVSEVGNPGTLRRIPGAASPVLGLAECRGNVTTVIDLAGLLGGAAAPGAPVLIRLAAPNEGLSLYGTMTLRLGRAVPEGDGVFTLEKRPYRCLKSHEIVRSLAARV